jgi:plastocyanin
MAIVPTIFNNVRLVGQESEFLDRKAGLRGEVYYDRDIQSLRIYPGNLQGGIKIARADQTASIDLSNVPNQTFKDKATLAGISASTTVSADPPSSPNLGELWFDTDTAILYIRYNDSDTNQWVQPANVQLGGGGGGSGNTFSTIAVSGQNSVIADTSADTLTLVAGSNIVISTDAGTDTITISATSVGGGSVSFGTVAVTGQTSVVADSSGDTLTLQAGTGISITTDATSDIVTITNTLSAASFATLTESSAASLTIDKVYLPAITRLTVNNSGTTAYTFDQYSGTNPTIYALSGTTIAFDLSGVVGHPLQIQDPAGDNYNTGLVHVASDGTVSTGTNAQAKAGGTLYWKVPQNISGNYRYQCSIHAAMVGSITVKNIQAI